MLIGRVRGWYCYDKGLKGHKGQQSAKREVYFNYFSFLPFWAFHCKKKRASIA